MLSRLLWFHNICFFVLGVTRNDFFRIPKQEKTLNSLKKDLNVIIVKQDKGSGVVLLNRSDYRDKMLDILGDWNKFRKLDDDPVKLTINHENIVKNFLKELDKNETIIDDLYCHQKPTGSRPGILYGLPKTHKCNAPLRPILSFFHSHSFTIAKFLVSLLRSFSVVPIWFLIHFALLTNFSLSVLTPLICWWPALKSLHFSLTFL